MKNRERGHGVRLFISNINNNIGYVEAAYKVCALSTWKGWGKEREPATLLAEGKLYKVILEPING